MGSKAIEVGKKLARRLKLRPVVDQLLLALLYLRACLRLGRLTGFRCVLVDGDRLGPLAERCDVILRWSQGAGRGIPVVAVVQGFVNAPLGEILTRHLAIIHAPAAYGALARRIWHNPPSWLQRFDLLDYPAIYAGASARLRPTRQVEQAGDQLLETVGAGPDDWVMAFSARDPAYLHSAAGNLDWSYHDYRNSAVEACLPAATEMVKRGAVAFRMGSAVDTSLPDERDPRIVDYANDHRTALLDVALLSRTRFFLVGGGSGIAYLAQIFDKPIAWHNFIPMNPWPWVRHDLFIPKLLRDVGTGRILSFDDMEKLGMFPAEDGSYRAGFSAGFYRERGLEPVENTPEEITALCVDMCEAIEGKPGDPDACRMAEEFRRRYMGPRLHAGHGGIAPSFMRRHEKLFA